MDCDKKSTLDYLSKLDIDLNLILDRFSKLDEKELAIRKSEDSWSTIEVLQHLYVSERASLKYIEYKINEGKKFEKAGLKHRAKTKFLLQFFKSPLKVKAPNVPGLDPINEDLKYENVKKEWLETRKKMRTYLGSLDEKYFEYAIYKHPLSGRINFRQTLAFFEVHIERHLRQISKIGIF